VRRPFRLSVVGIKGTAVNIFLSTQRRCIFSHSVSVNKAHDAFEMRSKVVKEYLILTLHVCSLKRIHPPGSFMGRGVGYRELPPLLKRGERPWNLIYVCIFIRIKCSIKNKKLKKQTNKIHTCQRTQHIKCIYVV